MIYYVQIRVNIKYKLIVYNFTLKLTRVVISIISVTCKTQNGMFNIIIIAVHSCGIPGGKYQV